MKKLNNDTKNWIILIIITALAYWVVNNLNIILHLLKTIFNVLYPFILGAIIAFILNIPTTKIEKFLNKYLKKKDYRIPVRIISIITSLVLLITIIALVAFLLVPELIESIKLLATNLPSLIDTIQTKVINLLDKYPDLQNQMQELFTKQEGANNIISTILNYVINSVIGFAGNIISSFITIFTAIIFSIYMVSQKEYLAKSCNKIITAYLSSSKAHKLIDFGKLLNDTFTKFISGQCVEAVILGSIIFLACLIFRFPYALIIATLTTITALVPIFGAIAAMTIGAILIGINSPLQTIIFIIVFQVVQQIEGNLIYPRVVGKSVGLSPMWTLLAITVGGSLFGIPGMIFGLPLASVAYTLIKNNVNHKLQTKQNQ